MKKKTTLNVDSVDPLSKEINELKLEIQSKIGPYRHLPKIILIGNTGAGKSSLLCSLANESLVISEGKGKQVVLNANGVQPGGESCTKIPMIKIDTTNQFILCDCPGFLDTGGVNQEIKNSFTIDYLFQSEPKMENKFKVIIVSSVSEIDSGRGQLIAESIKRASAMLKYPGQLESCIGLIITKGEEDINGSDFIDQLMDNPHESMVEWCNFFNNHRDRVFVFPKPSPKKIGQNYQFQERDKLISFMKKDYLINPIHVIQLGESATIEMETLQLLHSNAVTEIIHSLFEQMSISFRSEQSSTSCQNWINLLNKMIDAQIDNKNDLRRFINENFPNCSNEYDEFYTELESYENFDLFINRALENESITSTIQKSIQRCLYENIEELKKNLYYCKIIEEQLKGIEENDRQLDQLREQSIELLKKFEEQKEIMRKTNEDRKRMTLQLEQMQRTLEAQNQQLDMIRRQRQSSGGIGGFFKSLGGWVVSAFTGNPLPFFVSTISAIGDELQNND